MGCTLLFLLGTADVQTRGCGISLLEIRREPVPRAEGEAAAHVYLHRCAGRWGR